MARKAESERLINQGLFHLRSKQRFQLIVERAMSTLR